MDVSRRDFLKTSSLASMIALSGTEKNTLRQQIQDYGLEILDLLDGFAPFAGLNTFMKMPFSRDVNGAELVIMGVPFDSGTLNRSGTRYGPRAIREQSHYASIFQPVYPWDYDLTTAFKIIDFGDVVSIPGSGAVEFMLELTEMAAAEIFKAGASLLTLGGDHTLPYGMVRAAAQKYGKLALIHLDSHQDSGDSAEFGDEMRFINHGTFATDLANEGRIDLSKSSQVYIRTYMPATPNGGYTIFYANDALHMGAENLAQAVKALAGDAPVYLTLDIDALDVAYAPGTGSPVPGGPTTAEMRHFLQGLDGLNIVAADLVEVNPLYDPTQSTASAAAFLALDLLYLMGNARRRPQ